MLLMVAGCSRQTAPLEAEWQKALPATAVPKGLAGLRATDCGGCHAEVLEEWKTSAHANAWTDPQFQAEWKKDRNLWLCVSCHAPLRNQQPLTATGLVGGDVLRPVLEENAEFDPALRDEGLTCAACHVREGVVVGAGPPGRAAPHPLRTDRQALSVNACLRCHNAQARVTAALVCTFDTGDDWRRSGVAAAGVTCIDCHLPPVDRKGGKPGRKHDFLGAGIAKHSALAMRGRSGLTVELHPDPAGYPAGRTTSLRAVISNRLAGHTIPTGDVERWVDVEFHLVDGQGNRSLAHVERFGEKWEWYPAARRVSDTSLPRDGEREVVVPVAVPQDATALDVEVVIINHRITPENHASQKLPAAYPLSAEAFRSSTGLHITR